MSLKRLLTSLAKSNVDLGSGEIIVVLNGPDPLTVTTVADFVAALPLRLLFEPHIGQSRALNTGLAICRGDLVLLTDDDAEVSPHWIESYLKAFQLNPNAAYFLGPIEPVFGVKPGKLWLRHAPLSHGGRDMGRNESSWRDPVKACSLIGVNAGVPRLLLQQLEFEEQLGPGAPFARLGADIQLGRKLLATGRAAHYVPDARVSHHIPRERMTLAYLLARRRDGGRSCTAYDPGAVPPSLATTLAQLTVSAMRFLRDFLSKRSVDELFYAWKLFGVAESHLRALIHGTNSNQSSNDRR